jgi:ribosomal-protein-alanine N-acetyltransferase
MSAVRAEAVGPEDLVVTVTPMRRRHLRGVLRIEQQVYPRPWSLGLFMSELALRTSRVYLVARVGSTVVGYGGVMFAGPDGHVTNIAVDPAYHRRTVGTRLLLGLARQCVARGAQNLTLEVRTSNLGAQAMYRTFGFVPAGIRKNYYIETNEDAIVMWAHDIDGADYTTRLDGIEARLPNPTILDHLG